MSSLKQHYAQLRFIVYCNTWPSFFPYLVVFSSEHLYSHDGKNEPENEADQKDVEDTGNGLHESIYNDLGQKEEGKIETFPSCEAAVAVA